MGQINEEIPDDLHKRLKTLGIERDCTLNETIIEALNEGIKLLEVDDDEVVAVVEDKAGESGDARIKRKLE